MATRPATHFEDDLAIPEGISDLDRFRRWTWEPSFPDRGRMSRWVYDLETRS